MGALPPFDAQRGGKMVFEDRVPDKTIDGLRRIEGLLAYAVEHNDEAEIRRLILTFN